MITVILETATGHFVHSGEMPPFLRQPDVLTWGARTFTFYRINIQTLTVTYREAFTFALV